MSKRTARRYRRATASARQRSAVAISKAATPIAFVQTILRAYEKYNADPAEALRRARIAPGDLRRSEARVTSAQLETLTDFAMRELDDEALGWFSRKLPWGSYGMLCRASLTAPNLGIALKRWCRHHRLLTDDIILELSITAGTARLAIRENRRLDETRELCLLTSLRYPQGYASWVIDSRIPLQRVDFPFQTPRHAAVYALLFQAPVCFGAAQAAIAFDAQYLSLPLRRDEPALRNMLRCALPLTVRRYRSDRLVIQKLRAVLRTHRTDLRSGESVASALNLSLRTLHRRLAEEGTSFSRSKMKFDATRRPNACCGLRAPSSRLPATLAFATRRASCVRSGSGWASRRHSTGARPTRGLEPAEPRAAWQVRNRAQSLVEIL